ncbi:MAG: hypothetical protein DCC68_15015 [Planctomycetota bacterium]|nr:MAG: hypothetical protein DCC68_15015 [Planctomycetota bacterium]
MRTVQEIALCTAIAYHPCILGRIAGERKPVRDSAVTRSDDGHGGCRHVWHFRHDRASSGFFSAILGGRENRRAKSAGGRT